MKATEEVITERTYNGIPISEIKINRETFDAFEFFETYGWGDVGIVVEIFELNGCLNKPENNEKIFG